MSLLNRKAVRRYALMRAAEMRKGWSPTRVRKEFLDDIETLMKLKIIDKAIHSHPSVGKSLRFVL
jgi:hypothetical protein